MLSITYHRLVGPGVSLRRPPILCGLHLRPEPVCDRDRDGQCGLLHHKGERFLSWFGKNNPDNKVLLDVVRARAPAAAPPPTQKAEP